MKEKRWQSYMRFGAGSGKVQGPDIVARACVLSTRESLIQEQAFTDLYKLSCLIYPRPPALSSRKFSDAQFAYPFGQSHNCQHRRVSKRTGKERCIGNVQVLRQCRGMKRFRFKLA